MSEEGRAGLYVDPVANLTRIRAALNDAVRESRHDGGDIEILAVSKNHDAERILPLLEEGHRLFGENRVQEALAKWPPLKDRFPDVRLHLVGPLQSNKAREAVSFFDVIESLDRPKLARALAAEIERLGRAPALFVQVNIGEEAQKAGAPPQETDAFIAACRKDYGLEVSGLMCIPPADEPPAPYFALLAKIARRNGVSRLSMGMSGDYDIAARLGATEVRVGAALFGERSP